MENNKQTILHKEIDLIQDCIKRMANNSFLIKGWTVSLIAVVLALAKDKIDFFYICLILLVPVLCFWYLDTFFLRTEKMYRKMYEWVINNRMTSDERMYDLNPKNYESEVDSTFKVMFSKTLKVFFGIPTLILIVIILFHIAKVIYCNCLTH
jgi:hypothetical protein